MTLEYTVRIEKLPASEGGGYLATAPDLPGCMSDGETPEEALRNVLGAIACWIAAARERRLRYRSRREWRRAARAIRSSVRFPGEAKETENPGCGSSAPSWRREDRSCSPPRSVSIDS
jgi:predicted RNase H-like HicB family nuclease